jgi:hypothetical protein
MQQAKTDFDFNLEAAKQIAADVSKLYGIAIDILDVEGESRKELCFTVEGCFKKFTFNNTESLYNFVIGFSWGIGKGKEL